MPAQVFTVSIATMEALSDEEREEAAVELLRAANAILAAHLLSRDSLHGTVTAREEDE